jgi:hypothetical protein
MRLRGEDRTRLSEVKAPDAETVRAALRTFLGVTDLTPGQFAERVRRGESTIRFFMQDRFSCRTATTWSPMAT